MPGGEYELPWEDVEQVPLDEVSVGIFGAMAQNAEVAGFDELGRLIRELAPKLPTLRWAISPTPQGITVVNKIALEAAAGVHHELRVRDYDPIGEGTPLTGGKFQEPDTTSQIRLQRLPPNDPQMQERIGVIQAIVNAGTEKDITPRWRRGSGYYALESETNIMGIGLITVYEAARRRVALFARRQKTR